MDFGSWNVEVVIWIIAVLVACFLMYAGLRENSNARAVRRVEQRMRRSMRGPSSGMMGDDFDQVFNEITRTATRRGLVRAIFGFAILIICVGYLASRNNLL